MPPKRDARPLPTGPVIRLLLAVFLLVFVVVRAPALRIPTLAVIVLSMGLILIAVEQVRRIWLARRPPPAETVSKHPLGL